VTQPRKRVVIVGGGTAGWMSAACFARALNAEQYEIVLIESEEIGTVGVGEATIPPIIRFNAFLNINEDEFIRETNATFKLGIEFVNWRRVGDRYFHPFGLFGQDIESFPFQNYWFRDRLRNGSAIELAQYNLETMAAREGRFGRLKTEPNKPSLNYAFQFDAALYARYLRGYAEKRGVVRREGKIVKVNQDAVSGDVASVVMADQAEIRGDFWIDCSGFRGLLIEETLKSGYVDWSHWLPVDRAAAVPCERTDVLLPYTRATAQEAGWQWRIPLQHRTGNGYVFCSQFIGEEAAAAALVGRLDAPAMADPKILRFTAGHRKVVWNRNVVALGLASGFIEPLESTSIHFVQAGLLKLLTLFPREGVNPHIVAQYNRDMAFDYANVRDFIVAHYKVTEREDTPFWAYVKHMRIPDSLTERLEVYRTQGQALSRDPELFREPSWLAVLTGQGFYAEDYHPIADTMDEDDLRYTLGRQRSAVQERLKTLPQHEDFLRRNCMSDALKAYDEKRAGKAPMSEAK